MYVLYHVVRGCLT